MTSPPDEKQHGSQRPENRTLRRCHLVLVSRGARVQPNDASDSCGNPCLGTLTHLSEWPAHEQGCRHCQKPPRTSVKQIYHQQPRVHSACSVTRMGPARSETSCRERVELRPSLPPPHPPKNELASCSNRSAIEPDRLVRRCENMPRTP